MMKYEGVVWGFIILGIVYVFVNSEMGKRLVVKISKTGFELDISKEIPPKDIPDSESQKISSPAKRQATKIAPPSEVTEPKTGHLDSPKEESKLTNVALNKPVVYMSKKIVTVRGEWDRDGYYERYSVNRGNYPSNLTDGNPNTVAYPASWYFDYIIDLGGIYEIDRINLVWKQFGKRGGETYITAWNLSSQKKLTGEKALEEKDWNTIESRNYLDETETVLSLDPPIQARRLRIYAESVDTKKRALLNWIGIYEIQAWGRLVEE